MKIAVWYNLPSGGAKRALHDQITGLLHRGHSIDVWCPSTADTGYLSLSPTVREEVIPIALSELSTPMRMLYRFANANPEPLSRMIAMKRHAAQFAEIVNRSDYDLVMVHSCRWFATPFVGRHLRIPSVLYLQEPDRWLYEARPFLPWVAEPDSNLRWWDPRSLRNAIASALRVHPARVQGREDALNIRAFNRVLVNSFFSRECVLRSLGVDARVCYLGIDVTKFAPSHTKGDFVLSVGEFAPHKNPLFLIRAVAASAHKLRLIWAANRIDEGCLRDGQTLARECGVTLEVKLKVSEQELVQLYQTAALFLYAPRLEPFGFVPLEANACGTPAIAVAEGGIRETIQHLQTGILVDNDPQQMGLAISRLLSDPSELERLRRNAIDRVATEWSQAAAIDRLEGHLHEVLETTPKRSQTRA